MGQLDALMALPLDLRAEVLRDLSLDERTVLGEEMARREANPYLAYSERPAAFITAALDETVWSKQREIIQSVRDNRRTAVPACHAPGKSHLAARIVAWWVCAHPPGTARVLTTASTYRQVRGVLWPHIHRLHARHDLPGTLNLVEWKFGVERVAEGFSPGDNDETAVQGIHAPHLLVVVDEAGGIGPVLGRALESLMTGGHTRLLLLGNPPVDNEQSWFEKACDSPLYHTIPIAASDTPNFTGEDAGICKACPEGTEPHGVSTHLVDHEWVDEVTREFGPDSAFVEARVHARFPKGSLNKAIPLGWIEDAVANEEPDAGNRIRLGVDVAADGGDEFVIGKADGFRLSVVHHSAGASNASAVDVAGVVWEHMEAAWALHVERGITDRVRVKVDAIGVGWGVVSILKAWVEERKREREFLVIAVNVSETANDPEKFLNQRAEMWWNMRTLLQPRGDTGTQAISLADLETRAVAQLNGPTYKATSTGKIQIEAKATMKKRGLNSPDQAEALLLAVFEPPGTPPIAEVMPVVALQTNPWGAV